MNDKQRKAFFGKIHKTTPKVTVRKSAGNEFIVSVNGRRMWLTNKGEAQERAKELRKQLADERKRTGDNKSVWWKG